MANIPPVTQPIVLASSSPYRREILERIGLQFTAESPDINESRHAGEHPETLVRRLSMEKARAVAVRHPGAIIIGSDQVAEQEGEVIGKPGSHAAAVVQLRNASGKATSLYSGVAMINTTTGAEYCEVATVRVRCRVLTEQQIERYLLADQPYQCAGSLKVESLGITLLESIESDDPNAITGLPVTRLVSMLAKEGIVLP